MSLVDEKERNEWAKKDCNNIDDDKDDNVTVRLLAEWGKKERKNWNWKKKWEAGGGKKLRLKVKSKKTRKEQNGE